MEISTAKDARAWDYFLRQEAHSSLLQSWAWGEFQASLGKKIQRLEANNKGKTAGVSLLIVEKTKLGKFLYCPAGPVSVNQEFVQVWKEKVLGTAIEEKVDFIRVERPNNIVEKSLFKECRSTNSFIQPECTALLNLEKSEAELLSSMSDSTRYNIGWSKRKGIEVEVSEAVDDIDKFERLLGETAVRHQFVKQKDSGYYRKQFGAWVRAGMGKLLLAKSGGEVVAASIVTSFGDTTTYLHAASTTKVKLRQSYLMVWRAILEGKKTGSRFFDFWGVAPKGTTNHPWVGVTDFKMGFAPETVCYHPSLDYSLSPKYFLHRLLEVGRPLVRSLGR